MRFNLPTGYLEVSAVLFRNFGGLFGIAGRVSVRSGPVCRHFNDCLPYLHLMIMRDGRMKCDDHSDFWLGEAEEVDGLDSKGDDNWDGEVV